MKATLSFSSPSDLAKALKDASEAHHYHEQAMGETDPNWHIWYADYLWHHVFHTLEPLFFGDVDAASLGPLDDIHDDAEAQDGPYLPSRLTR